MCKSFKAIECRQLSKVFSKGWFGRGSGVPVLRDISLSISPGEIVGLVGPNGAGKTTLMNLITGLLLPSKGTVAIHGHPARSIEARRGLGYMPELPTFLGLYTPRKVLQYHGALAGIPRKEVKQRSDELLSRVELTAAANRRCATFSQGMRQRLALAVALIGRPRVLILDEPTNGLDPVGIAYVREMLLQLKGTGMTILVSSHRLNELDKMVSTLVMLHRGQLVEDPMATTSPPMSRLYIGIAPGTCSDAALKGLPLIESTGMGVVLSIESPNLVPAIVRGLVSKGVDIMSVKLEGDDLETRFLRLLEGRKQ